MVCKALLKEVVSAGRTEIILAAGEHLAGKIKAGYDIKKLFVETGEFLLILNHKQSNYLKIWR